MLDSYQDLIEGLTATPSKLRELLGSPVPDNVSKEARSLLAELCNREKVEVRRVQVVMRDRKARLRPIQYEPEVADPSSAPDEPEAMLQVFNNERSELISLLVNLTLRDWDQKVDHDEKGEITLADEIDDHLTWDEEMQERFETMLA
ncbi:MAG: hypothetical protein M3412_03355 [Chloroflexota bacterium]|jgi:hypothetical protein|nr:hypothetical protein [Chloroflexota bacterium]